MWLPFCLSSPLISTRSALEMHAEPSIAQGITSLILKCKSVELRQNYKKNTSCNRFRRGAALCCTSPVPRSTGGDSSALDKALPELCPLLQAPPSTSQQPKAAPCPLPTSTSGSWGMSSFHLTETEAMRRRGLGPGHLPNLRRCWKQNSASPSVHSPGRSLTMLLLFNLLIYSAVCSNAVRDTTFKRHSPYLTYFFLLHRWGKDRQNIGREKAAMLLRNYFRKHYRYLQGKVEQQ